MIGKLSLWCGEVRDGEVNYTISRILNAFYNRSSYSIMERAIGALECCKLEFYREVVAPYEEKKKELNGKVYE